MWKIMVTFCATLVFDHLARREAIRIEVVRHLMATKEVALLREPCRLSDSLQSYLPVAFGNGDSTVAGAHIRNTEARTWMKNFVESHTTGKRVE